MKRIRWGSVASAVLKTLRNDSQRTPKATRSARSLSVATAQPTQTRGCGRLPAENDGAVGLHQYVPELTIASGIVLMGIGQISPGKFTPIVLGIQGLLVAGYGVKVRLDVGY